MKSTALGELGRADYPASPSAPSLLPCFEGCLGCNFARVSSLSTGTGNGTPGVELRSTWTQYRETIRKVYPVVARWVMSTSAVENGSMLCAPTPTTRCSYCAGLETV